MECENNGTASATSVLPVAPPRAYNGSIGSLPMNGSLVTDDDRGTNYSAAVGNNRSHLADADEQAAAAAGICVSDFRSSFPDVSKYKRLEVSDHISVLIFFQVVVDRATFSSLPTSL